MLNTFQQINQRRKALIIVILFTFPCYCLGIFAWYFTPEDYKNKPTATITDVILYQTALPNVTGTATKSFEPTLTFVPTLPPTLTPTGTNTMEPTWTNTPEASITPTELLPPTYDPTDTETPTP